MLKWIEIDLSAIAFNLENVLKRLSAGVRLMAVVKEDAYGHGAAPVAELCARQRVEALGVLTLEEASSLRQAGIRTPIHLLCPSLKEDAEEVVRRRLIPTLDSVSGLESLDRTLRKNPRLYAGRYPFTLDLDFGLGRWGILPPHLPRLLSHIRRIRTLLPAGLSTHLDYVPGKNAVEAEEKLKIFEGISRQMKKEWPGIICHAANSSILMDFPHRQMGLVRIGNLLYGINPASGRIALKNPWQFYAKIVSIKKIPKGRPIGYDSEYVPAKAMTVGTLAVGYADGLTMEPAERLIRLRSGFQYWGSLGGRQAPFIGRCGIAHTLIDLSRIPSARVGDVVSLPIRRTAANPKIPRIYKGGSPG